MTRRVVADGVEREEEVNDIGCYHLGLKNTKKPYNLKNNQKKEK